MLSIPFPGSKRNSYKDVKEIFQSGGYDAVLEPFGGSGVLSVNLANDGLAAGDCAVINDYDRFFDDYEEYLDVKDWIVAEALKRGLKKKTNVKLKPMDCEILQGIISKVNRKWWPYLVRDGNFNFRRRYSHKRINLTDFVYFGSRLETSAQRSYLEILSKCRVVSMDWREFLKLPMPGKNPLVIADPPYAGTLQGHYGGAFTVEETWELARSLVGSGSDFIFFSNDFALANSLFAGIGAEIREVGCKVLTSNGKRPDVMAYIKQTVRPEQLKFI